MIRLTHLALATALLVIPTLPAAAAAVLWSTNVYTDGGRYGAGLYDPGYTDSDALRGDADANVQISGTSVFGSSTVDLRTQLGLGVFKAALNAASSTPADADSQGNARAIAYYGVRQAVTLTGDFDGRAIPVTLRTLIEGSLSVSAGDRGSALASLSFLVVPDGAVTPVATDDFTIGVQRDLAAAGGTATPPTMIVNEVQTASFLVDPVFPTFSLLITLELEAAAGGFDPAAASALFGNTITLAFDLPDGIGYTTNAPAIVTPLPAPALLLAGSLLVVTARRRIRAFGAGGR